MPHGYEIVVTFVGLSAKSVSSPQSIFLQAGSAELHVILQALDACPNVCDIHLYSTLSIPHLHRLSKLSQTDIGVAENKFRKIK